MRCRPRHALVAAVLLAVALPAVVPADAQQVAPGTTLLQSTLAGLREVGPDGALGAGDRDGVGSTLERRRWTWTRSVSSKTSSPGQRRRSRKSVATTRPALRIRT